MKTASISEIKKELNRRSYQEVVDLCLRQAKYKLDNKELLTYLLFEAGDELAYIQGVRDEVDALFADINHNTTYLIKKSLRKILRRLNKYIKYSGHKRSEVELRLHFCRRLHESGIDYKQTTALMNLYSRQMDLIVKAIDGLHEDLQFDYKHEMLDLAL